MTVAWRFALVLTVLACMGSFSEALYADPPHAYVAQQNDALGPSIQGLRVPVGGSRPRESPLRFFSIDLRAAYPSIDGTVSSAHPPRVLWGWSYDAQSDYDWDGSLSSCGSNRSRMIFSSASGQFTLVSQLPGITRIRENPPSPAPSGFNAAELASSIGPLSVHVEGKLFLQYAREVHTVQCRSFCYWNGCSIQSWIVVSHDAPVFEYPASSSVLSMPLAHPANQTLSPTPWIRNFSLYLPSMQAYLYSNTSLYWLESRWDGMLNGYQRFQSFDVRSDDRGALFVVSVSNQSVGSEPDAPARFQRFSSTSYRHGYSVDQATDARLEQGHHEWSVRGFDFFGDAVELKQDFSAHDAVRVRLDVPDGPIAFGNPFDASVRLTDRAGRPLSGLPIRIETPDAFWNLTSDSVGHVRVRTTPMQSGAYRIVARFSGSSGRSPSFADAVVYVASEPVPPDDVLRRHDGLLLGLLFILALCAVRFR